MRRVVGKDARLLAYHEAGHAVVAWALKRPVHSISIIPDKRHVGRLPQNEASADERATTQAEREHDVMVLLAGVEAESLLTQDHDWWGADDDRQMAERLIADLVRDGLVIEPADEREAELRAHAEGDEARYCWTALQARTYALARQLPVRSAVAALVHALLAAQELSAQQVTSIIRQGIAAADPDTL